MPTAPTLVQSKSGSALGTEGTTPVVASLDSAITEGNTVLICASTPDVGAAGVGPVLSAKPGDFDVAIDANHGPTVANGVCVLYRVAGASDATTWGMYPFGTSVRVSWVACEYSGLPSYEFSLATLSNLMMTPPTAATPVTTETTGALGHSGTLQIAIFNSATATTWSGYTAGFTEIGDVGQAPSLAVAAAYSESLAPATCSALQTVANNLCMGTMLVFPVADATFHPELVFQDGFERQTENGIANATNPTASTRAASAVAGTVGTHVLIGSAYSAGAWSQAGLRLIQASGSIRYVRWDTNIIGTQRDLVVGAHLRVVSSTGTARIAEIPTLAGSEPQLLYDTTTQKLGVRFGSSGTVGWQNGTTAANTWVWLDWLVRGVGGTSRSSQWALDHVEQPSPPPAGGGGSEISHFHLGSANSAITATTDWDDLIVSGIAAMYPFTRHHVRLLPVDPAGTPSVSGTAANFNVFTANTTLAAWNATNARDAVDEVPPTISASSDGVTQITTAASDYAEFPMSTYVVAGPEVASGVCVWATAWSGAGAGSGTMRIDGYDGTTAATLFPIGTAWLPGSVTTPSSTVPPWIRAMWTPAGGWDQTKLDAAALRFGFSSDATPDMGVHNLFCELAVRVNAYDESFPVHSWRVDYTDNTSHASASGPPTVTTGVRGVTYWQNPAPYMYMDHGWPAYRVAGVTLFGGAESDETFEAWRLSVLAEPHPLA